MARRIEGPWFRSARNSWYATVAGKNVALGVGGKENRAAAQAAWHRLMADGKPDKPAHTTVADLLKKFLDSKRQTVKPATHLVYRCLAKHLARALGHTPLDKLTRSDAERKLALLRLSPNTRHDVAGLLASACRWAAEQGWVRASPVQGIKRPPRTGRGRDGAVSPETHRRLVEAASARLRDLLELLFLTGARPGELARLTAADVDFANGAAVLREHKTARTGKARVVVLVEAASALLRRLAEERPTGPLLRNDRGNPWTKDAVVLAVRRAAHRAGVRATAYGYRHGYATAALEKGVPDAAVAALLGHSSTAVLHRHYSHITQSARYLRSAAAGVRE